MFGLKGLTCLSCALLNNHGRDLEGFKPINLTSVGLRMLPGHKIVFTLLTINPNHNAIII